MEALNAIQQGDFAGALTPPEGLQAFLNDNPNPDMLELFAVYRGEELDQALAYLDARSGLAFLERLLPRVDLAGAEQQLGPLYAQINRAESRYQAFSPRGQLIQAGGALLVLLLALIVHRRTAFGATAGPALLVAQIIAGAYMVLMLWGTVINPEAAHKKLLVSERFTGLLTENAALGDKIDPSIVQNQIDDLLAQSQADGISPEEAQARAPVPTR